MSNRHNKEVHGKLVKAHFSSHELEMLDELQGGRITDPETGLPTYVHLAHMIDKSPDIEDHLDEIFASGEAHRRGEETHLSQHWKKVAEEGEHGDNELAIIPIELAHILDHMIGGKSINPETGYRQYFLGALLSLASRAIPSIIKVATRVAPAISKVARGAVSMAGRVAPKLGNLAKAAGTAARGAASTIGKGISTVGRNLPRALSTVGRNVGRGAMQAAQFGGKAALGTARAVGNNLGNIAQAAMMIPSFMGGGGQQQQQQYDPSQDMNAPYDMNDGSSQYDAPDANDTVMDLGDQDNYYQPQARSPQMQEPYRSGGDVGAYYQQLMGNVRPLQQRNYSQSQYDPYGGGGY